ncbi:hypothetical protein [Methylocucumis oryzae]|uniref:hypothetical protein n=1 Tax=Methylocucumis oryzae TaxID=1632867 RepID=UPI000696F944|nr:hypothetical protein [Methylocucumis oryzae]
MQKSPIKRIVNFEKYLVFDSAMITTAIVHFEKNGKTSFSQAFTLKENIQESFESLIRNKDNFTPVQLKSDSVFALINNETNQLNAKLDANKAFLGELLWVGSGMQTAANDVFSNSQITKQSFPKEFLKKKIERKSY